MTSWPLLAGVSVVWLVVTGMALMKQDWANLLIYGGIFLTNTGLAIHALH